MKDLSGAHLTNANLSGANLTLANLTLANLTLADLKDAIWMGTSCPDATNSDANGGTCCGHFNGAVPSAGCDQAPVALCGSE